MKYSTKSAQYYSYFEDAKILEIDNENKKLAIVLNGKDDIINIFDASPYVNYNPFEYISKQHEIENELNKKKIGIVQIEEQGKNLDVNQIFEEIQNYKSNYSQNSNKNNSNQIMYNQNSGNNIQKNKREASTFNRMLSVMNKEKKDNKKEKEKNIKNIKRYDSLSISKFIIYYISPQNYIEKANICFKKPKITHRLLSVIELIKDSVLGIRWFSFGDFDYKKNIRNMSEKEIYFLRSKLILVVSQEGCISVYKLIDYSPFQNTRVSLKMKNLQSQPFHDFRERYAVAASVNISNPVLDFNLLDKSLLNDEYKDTLRLVTLHINNSFTFWYIVNQKNKIELRIQYNFTLPDFQCENFLIDTREEYLICFNKKGINIYLSKGQSFPYPLVYRYTFNDILPSLEELKKIIFTNEIINDDDNEEKKEKPEKQNKKKKQQDNKKNEKKKNKKKVNKDDDLIIFNIENEEEEEFDEEDDDFILEGNPDFIDKDIDTFLDDDQFLKFLQKPFFLSSETKFLFVNYEVKSNLYSLYCFNFVELFQVEENKEFLDICLNNYDPNLITKIYSSKEKLYLQESPFYYFNPIKEDSFDKSLLNTINGRKSLMDQKIEFKTILDNSYHGIFIRDGDYIMIIKIGINYPPELDLINNDINSSKFLFYEQPTSENLKSNRFAVWTVNNTLIVNSVDNLFSIIKFRNEFNVLGIAISKKKVVEYFGIYYNS